MLKEDNINIYNYLKKDHQSVEDILEKILSSKNLEKRELMFQQVAKKLLIHAETENATFYAALKDHEETAEIIEESKKEHAEIKDYIKKINDISSDSEKWLEQFGEFKHSVIHRIKEEESHIFEKSKKVLSSEQANQIAIDMDSLKNELNYA